MNELWHYGVLGMKWGVRKDRDRVSIANRIKPTTDPYKSGKITKNSDGSITITGMKGTQSATFKNEKIYEYWRNGDYNPFAMNSDIRNMYAENLAERNERTLHGIGYKIDFKDYEAESQYLMDTGIDDLRHKIANDRFMKEYGKQYDAAMKDVQRNEYNDEQLWKKYGYLEDAAYRAYNEMAISGSMNEVYARILEESEGNPDYLEAMQEELDDYFLQVCKEYGINPNTLSNGMDGTLQAMIKIGKQKSTGKTVKGYISSGKSFVDKIAGAFKSGWEATKRGVSSVASKVSKAAKDFAKDIMNRIKKK